MLAPERAEHGIAVEACFGFGIGHPEIATYFLAGGHGGGRGGLSGHVGLD